VLGGAEGGLGDGDGEVHDDSPGVEEDSGWPAEHLPSCPLGVGSDTVGVDSSEGVGEHRQVGGQRGGPHPRLVHPVVP